MIDIIVLGLNGYGEKVYDWLVDRDDANVYCVITDETQYPTIEALEPQLLISAGFKYIIPDRILQIPELGAVNLHHSYLPYNRGYNPDVWSIIEGTPAGVSLHYMNPEIDSGSIINRRKVKVEPDDTSKTLYERLEKHQVAIFKENWQDIKTGDVELTEQDNTKATFHYKQDFIDLWEIDESANIQVGEFIDRLRALTHPPYNNAYITRNGSKYFVRIEITAESKLDHSGSIHWNIPAYSEGE